MLCHLLSSESEEKYTSQNYCLECICHLHQAYTMFFITASFTCHVFALHLSHTHKVVLHIWTEVLLSVLVHFSQLLFIMYLSVFLYILLKYLSTIAPIDMLLHFHLPVPLSPNSTACNILLYI